MSPEFGATATLFPVDSNTLRYLKLTGRGALVDSGGAIHARAGIVQSGRGPEPRFNEVLDLDLGQVEPSAAGPKRPQDRVPLSGVRGSFERSIRRARGARWTAGHCAAWSGKAALLAGEVLESSPEPIGKPRAATP